jgi:hypothetical protein
VADEKVSVINNGAPFVMTTFMLYSYVGTSVIVCCKKSTRVLQSVGYTPPSAYPDPHTLPHPFSSSLLLSPIMKWSSRCKYSKFNPVLTYGSIPISSVKFFCVGTLLS